MGSRLAAWQRLDYRRRPLGSRQEFKRRAGAVSSLEHDQRLAQDTARRLRDVIKGSGPSNLSRAMRDFCRANTLQGPRATYRLPLVRIVTKDALAASILAQTADLDLGWLPDDVAAILGDLESPDRWQYAANRLHDVGVQISRFVTWSSFIRAGDTQLENLSAQEIAGEFGLDINDPDELWEPGTVVYILKYNPPSDQPTHVLFPTAIEAIASDPLNYYFVPAPEGSHYGITKAWPIQCDGVGRPEVVHKPWLFDVLETNLVAVQ